MDHFQVRLYKAWHRYVTLAVLALAWLAVTRAALADDDTLEASTNAIRRMFTALCAPSRDERRTRRWSRWRHRHQERARHYHFQRQHQEDP